MLTTRKGRRQRPVRGICPALPPPQAAFVSSCMRICVHFSRFSLLLSRLWGVFSLFSPCLEGMVCVHVNLCPWIPPQLCCSLAQKDTCLQQVRPPKIIFAFVSWFCNRKHGSCRGGYYPMPLLTQPVGYCTSECNVSFQRASIFCMGVPD